MCYQLTKYRYQLKRIDIIKTGEREREREREREKQLDTVSLYTLIHLLS